MPPTMVLRCSLTHHNIGVSKQIVLEGTGLAERGKSGPNDHLFEDPHAQHIFINVTGLTREAAIVFDATKKYEVVITEAISDSTPAPESVTSTVDLSSLPPMAPSADSDPAHTD